MSSDDVYRQHAAEAERQAQLARNDLDRAAWLRVADGWRGLLRRRPPERRGGPSTPKVKPRARGKMIPIPELRPPQLAASFIFSLKRARPRLTSGCIRAVRPRPGFRQRV